MTEETWQARPIRYNKENEDNNTKGKKKMNYYKNIKQAIEAIEDLLSQEGISEETRKLFEGLKAQAEKALKYL